MNRGQAIRRNLDWVSILMYTALVMIGLVAIYSACFNAEHAQLWDFSQPYGKQVMWIGICSFVALLTLNIEGEFFNRFSPIIYLAILIS
ncbi:MAG: rod shape-determining protein RodA, partial [Flavobacteriales bacterium]